MFAPHLVSLAAIVPSFIIMIFVFFFCWTASIISPLSNSKVTEFYLFFLVISIFRKSGIWHYIYMYICFLFIHSWAILLTKLFFTSQIIIQKPICSFLLCLNQFLDILDFNLFSKKWFEKSPISTRVIFLSTSKTDSFWIRKQVIAIEKLYHSLIRIYLVIHFFFCVYDLLFMLWSIW